MKKRSYVVTALLLLISAPTFTSCFVGSFSCLNKMLEWNENITDNRYVSALISVLLGPVEFCVGGFFDTIVFNTMEFWSGSNPMASTQIVEAQDGNLYAVSPNGKGGYLVTCQQSGQQMEYLFDAATRTWTASLDGREVRLFTLTSPDEALVYIPNSDPLSIRLDAQGLYACERAVSSINLAMN